MREIANSMLTRADIPSPDTEWQAIAEFALTFNGYEFWGSFEKCAEIANTRQQETLTDLRTCLFFEQRRWRHFGREPAGEDMTYLRELVEKIRRHVSAGNVAAEREREMPEMHALYTHNPWQELPHSPPYVLPDDRAPVAAFNLKSTETTKCDLNLFPEPFFGRPDAPVVITDY
jgi:hypothetical protein